MVKGIAPEPKPNTSKSSKSKAAQRSRRRYRKKLERLAYLFVAKSDQRAGEALEAKCKRNPAAEKIIEQMAKSPRFRNRVNKEELKSRIKGPKQAIYGSAGRPYAGGSPGQGKRS